MVTIFIVSDILGKHTKESCEGFMKDGRELEGARLMT